MPYLASNSCFIPWHHSSWGVHNRLSSVSVISSVALAPGWQAVSTMVASRIITTHFENDLNDIFPPRIWLGNLVLDGLHVQKKGNGTKHLMLYHYSKLRIYERKTFPPVGGKILLDLE